jgi:hypothetical protein
MPLHDSLNSPDTGLLPCLIRSSQSFWITRLSRILRKVQAPFLRLFEASAATQKVWVPSLPSRLISSCPHLVHYRTCLYFALIISRKIIFTELISYTEAGARLAEDPDIEILNIVDSLLKAFLEMYDWLLNSMDCEGRYSISDH